MNDAERAAYDAGVRATLACLDAVAAVVPALVPPGVRQVTMSELAEAVAHVDTAQLATLRPFTVDETLSPKEAATIAGVSESAIRGWCERYRIGRQVVGALRVSHPALLMLLEDRPLALGAYLAGDRGPLVQPFFDRARLKRPNPPEAA